jgi:hypothetical protein
VRRGGSLRIGAVIMRTAGAGISREAVRISYAFRRTVRLATMGAPRNTAGHGRRRLAETGILQRILPDGVRPGARCALLLCSFRRGHDHGDGNAAQNGRAWRFIRRSRVDDGRAPALCARPEYRERPRGCSRTAQRAGLRARPAHAFVYSFGVTRVSICALVRTGRRAARENRPRDLDI